MKKAADHPTPTPKTDTASFTLGGAALQLLDTTWRIAVPVIIVAVVGILLDKRLHTAPWLTLAGMAVGFVIAGLLVKQQIDKVNREERS
ncbi:MAG TPA: AtpZ/AtpI family protein [Candidatus Saccharimonadales bacterium]|jgi:F0F1-type ATP synthase assembly protein I|nr:AtpZ/AtpI family protein [Candidatus Saccharimonadales bacterium]